MIFSCIPTLRPVSFLFLIVFFFFAPPLRLYDPGSSDKTCLSEWASGDRDAAVEWDYGVTDEDVAFHRFQRQTQLLFSETRDQAEWGTWYWAVHNETGLTYQSGEGMAVRETFANDGKLSNSRDSDFRAISKDWPVFGFAIDLGSVGSEAVNRLFTIGLDQREAIQFDGANGSGAEPSLWTDYFEDGEEAVCLIGYE